jgi:hypothetical protein
VKEERRSKDNSETLRALRKRREEKTKTGTGRKDR